MIRISSAPIEPPSVRRPRPNPLLIVLGLAATLSMTMTQPAHGAPTADANQARQQYEAERAQCNAVASAEERRTCLQSAGAAYNEARAGRLDVLEHPYEQNKLDRCRPLPPDDRSDCIRRMRGEGARVGSVSGGGIYRELDTLEVSPAPPVGAAHEGGDATVR